MWLLRATTYPEIFPISIPHGWYVFEDDICILQGLDGVKELGEVAAVENARKSGTLRTVKIRVFRRPR